MWLICAVHCKSADDSHTVAEFLIHHPELRHIVRRVQTTARYLMVRLGIIWLMRLPAY